MVQITIDTKRDSEEEIRRTIRYLQSIVGDEPAVVGTNQAVAVGLTPPLSGRSRIGVPGGNMIGQTIGHYRIVEKLGQGGMGVVYRAHDETLNRAVALKVLPRDRGRSQERVGRFRREAEVLAALDHPNIVTIHAIEEIDGSDCIVMEYVRGRTLRERIWGSRPHPG